jgi:hypothetical protein
LERKTDKKPPIEGEDFPSIDEVEVDEIRPTNVGSIFEKVLGVSLEDSKEKSKE